jgi:catechol 2,3-dioxygenase-like lactoylglutathione lyase family enzyme
MIKPKPTAGMRHVALLVRQFEACESFYVDLMGMQVEWRPDENSVYLTSGNDNLALHRASDNADGYQTLDHIGFIINEAEQVDEWYDYLRAHDIKMKTVPKTHRDGARSFYCYDPEGVTVQIIYHKPLVGKEG